MTERRGSLEPTLELGRRGLDVFGDFGARRRLRVPANLGSPTVGGAERELRPARQAAPVRKARWSLRFYVTGAGLRA
jgi:hypothetical protein